MLKIYLARHGQDEDNANGLLNGHRNTPLTKIGLKQAHELAAKIKESGLKFDHVFTSPLKRAFKTAEIVCETLELPKPEVVDLLTERSFGKYDGFDKSKITTEFSPKNLLITETINYILDPGGGETFPDLMKRGEKAKDYLENRFKKGNILVVTHGDFGKMLYASYYDLDWREVLKMFHFGNSELILLSPDSKAEDVHVFKIEQHNN
jgi:probable phosphoglycerate mutase